MEAPARNVHSRSDTARRTARHGPRPHGPQRSFRSHPPFRPLLPLLSLSAGRADDVLVGAGARTGQHTCEDFFVKPDCYALAVARPNVDESLTGPGRVAGTVSPTNRV